MRFAGPVLAFLLLAGVALWLSERRTGWAVSPDFAGTDARYELSGAACSPAYCLAVNDETNRAQVFAIDGRTLVPGRTVLLSDDEDEIDAEAAAYGGGHFYITGSHGLSRKKAKFRASQFQVFRLSNEDGGIERSTRLRGAIQTALPRFAEQPLDENGVTIEGLAVAGDRLFFGFRGPSVAGKAFVFEISATALFGTVPLDATTHEIPLGKDTGIRDMARIEDGFLLLTGPVNDELPRQTVVFWRPGAEPQILSSIRSANGAKAETLLVLSETSEIRALVLFDGLENGGPVEIALPEPAG